MSVTVRLLRWLADRRPAREIRNRSGAPYLERFFLFRLGGGAAYLHRFLGSDDGPDLHDHPWGWSVGLVLAGGYDEHRLADRESGRITVRQLRPGRINLIRGGDFHRLELTDGTETWTLFLHGPWVREWGFLVAAPEAFGRFVRRGEHHPETPARSRWWLDAPKGRALRRLNAGSAVTGGSDV